jgi:large subunit ribosomal protein LP1
MSTDSTKAETAVSYAALILADAKINITADKLQTLLEAAGVEDVEPIWTTLFAKALEGKDVKTLLTTVAASGPGQSPGQGAAPKEETPQDGTNETSEDNGEKHGDDASDDGSDFGISLFD